MEDLLSDSVEDDSNISFEGFHDGSCSDDGLLGSYTVQYNTFFTTLRPRLLTPS